MSIVLPPYNFPVSPVPNITPFTYRDGVTYLERMEDFIKWLNTVVLPFVNDNYSELADTFTEEVNSLITTVNTALADQTEANNTALTAVNNAVSEAEASKEAAEAARDLAEQFASTVQAVQDSAITTIFTDLDSDFRVAFNSIVSNILSEDSDDEGTFIINIPETVPDPDPTPGTIAPDPNDPGFFV